MFVPIHDANPLKSIRLQYVTIALITLNVLAYLLIDTTLIPEFHRHEADFALIPAEFLGEAKLPAVQVKWLEDPIPLPEQFTIISYMFLHGGVMHLIGNMLFLWVFGDNVEDAMGHIRFLMFYLMCGIFAGLAHTLAVPSSQVPLVGASGAVAGVVAAYLMLHPRVKIWVLVLFRIPLRVNAGWALGFWAGLQFFNVIVAEDGDVAWWAHVGGLIAGAVLILFMRRPGVILFDRTRSGA